MATEHSWTVDSALEHAEWGEPGAERTDSAFAWLQEAMADNPAALRLVDVVERLRGHVAERERRWAREGKRSAASEPAAGEDGELYRNVVSVEVLSGEPSGDEIEDLDTLHYQITEGHSSGKVTRTVANEKVTRERMAELLTAQGSDPEFLLGDGDPEAEDGEEA